MCYKYLYDIKVIIITPLLNTSKCNLTFKCRINCPKSFNRNKKSEIKKQYRINFNQNKRDILKPNT